VTMSLSSNRLNAIRSKVDAAWLAIWEIKHPPSKRNDASIAWEYWLASFLSSAAEKKRRAVEKEAIKAGVLIDKEKKPEPVGTDRVVYPGDIVNIRLEVREGRTSIDANKMAEYLVSKGVKQKLVEDAMNHAEVKTRPAHVFTATIPVVD
jgi:hypothetical protein